MAERSARYRLRLFTWIFLGFFAGSIVFAALIGLVALRSADTASLDVARQEMLTAVDLAAIGTKEPLSQRAFAADTASYRRGLVLYEPGPLIFTLVNASGHIDATTPARLDGQEISAAALRLFRSAARGSAVLYLPLRRGRYLLAWVRTRDGYLSALAPVAPLEAAMIRNLLGDLLYAVPIGLLVVLGTALGVGLLLNHSTRRLRQVRDEASAEAVLRGTHVSEVAEIARRWGDVLHRERRDAQSLAQAFAWRDRLMSWLAAVSAQENQDLPSLARRIVDQLPFSIAQLAVADRQSQVCRPLAMSGYGTLTAHDLTMSLDPPVGLAANAYHLRRTVRWPQDRDLANPGVPDRLQVRMAVAVPLIAAGEVRGVLSAAVREGQDLPPEAVQSLEQIAPLLGALIARQDALDRLRRQERLFAWVQEMNPLLLVGDAGVDWWPPVQKALAEIVGARAAIILLRSGNGWQVAGSFGPGLPLLFAGAPIREWQAKIDLEPQRFLGWHEEGALTIGGIGHGGRPDSVLLVLQTPDPERQVLLHTLFDYLALASETVVRREAAEALARTDPLTGVLNRRALEEHFEHDLEAHLASGGPPFLFVLLDLDNFKQFNDRDGHAAGDLALRQFGRHLQSRVRQGDALGRIGGDEFVLLLKNAEDLASDRLQSLVAASIAPGRLDASFGFALVPREAGSFAEAYRLADRRMYALKRERHRAAKAEEGA